MNPIANQILKSIPPELLELAKVAADWFSNSGYKEQLDKNGTTGLNHIITNIEGTPHVITFAISRLTEAEIEQTNKILTDITANKLNAEEN